MNILFLATKKKIKKTRIFSFREKELVSSVLSLHNATFQFRHLFILRVVTKQQQQQNKRIHFNEYLSSEILKIPELVKFNGTIFLIFVRVLKWEK